MSNKTYESVDQNTRVLMAMIEELDYLQLTALENAIQQRRYNMRKEAGKAFDTIEKVGE